ncbi:FecR family protein [Chitinophaga sp. CF118]|uniref:FecR family protein n=1 Tax=Chitinophaga sp. CF118 TaxID=1884367 RepID=UPI0008F23D52|nr:FecR family protein [Chitinophaga sp. CF118]SFD15562.1 FecR family protein [Chitinophaga sp. CF118]
MQPNSEVSPLLVRILYKCLSGAVLSSGEQQTLDEWLDAEPQNKIVYAEIMSGEWPVSELKYYNSISYDDNWARVQQKIAGAALYEERPVKRLRFWWAAAAIVFVLLGGIWFLKQQTQPKNEKGVQLADIAPGTQGAILTLADGSTVVLDSLNNGVVASQHGVKAVLMNGELLYQKSGSESANTIVYNSMTTPKGRQFHLVLPDGSHVWLNAQSSIRYPTTFTGKERRVNISGEVYFEVKKDEQKPFIVNVPDRAEIAVLGTDFNIKAYIEEPSLNTTLVNGTVKVLSTKGQNAILKPGYTAQILTSRPDDIKIVPADIDQVLAWKNGAFYFDDATLQEVMRELSRWYDIEVVYEPGLPETRFGGKISRDVSLAGLLRGLQATGVHYRIEQGRKLVVYK